VRNDLFYLLNGSGEEDFKKSLSWTKRILQDVKSSLHAELFGFQTPSQERKRKMLISRRRLRQQELRRERFFQSLDRRGIKRVPLRK
jgi:hypothetical protein